MEKQWQAQAPQVIFTLDQLELLRKALIPLERIARSREPLPNLEFALTTIVQVQAKIQHMIQVRSWDMVVGFDGNEMLVLRTGVHIYVAALEMMEPSPQGEEVKKRCEELDVLLTPLIPPGCIHD